MPNLKGAVQVFPSDITAIDTTQGFPLGTRGLDDKGNEYVYVQNLATGATWAVGKVLMPAATVTAAATVTSSTDKLTISKTSWGLTAGAYSGYYVFVTNGGDEGDLKVIKGNDATNLFLETALTSALNGTSALAIFHPYVCDLTTASGQVVPVGVAMAAVTVGNYGWAQVRGVAPVIVSTGAPTAAKNIATGGATTAGQGVIGTTAKGPFDEDSIGYVFVTNTNNNKAVATILKGVS